MQQTWKTVFLVLRPNTISIYKSDNEDKLRHKVYLSDLTAVTLLKDPKNKRQNVFGLFSPSKNYHFQTSTLEESRRWVEVIRENARIEEEEEEMFLASPVLRRQSYMPTSARDAYYNQNNVSPAHQDRFGSSSPEMIDPALIRISFRRPSQLDSPGMSGNDLGLYSDVSDTDVQRNQGTSIESLAVQSPLPSASFDKWTGLDERNASQQSGICTEQEHPDRVVWQGRVWLLKNKRGVRQWKDSWAVLRPRNLILYKDKSEYLAHFVLPLSSIVNVVEIDAVSKSKMNCLQIITEEKSYRLCAQDEEALIRCLGAFKSLLAKRRDLEAKATLR